MCAGLETQIVHIKARRYIVENDLRTEMKTIKEELKGEMETGQQLSVDLGKYNPRFHYKA